MAWLEHKLDSLKKTIVGERPVEFTYVPEIPVHEVPNTGQDFEPDECYVSLYVESLRLERARRFGTRFNGLVYSMVTLAREWESTAKLTAVSKPDRLSELDDSGIGKVITVTKEMMAPTAYRGGAVSLELGLFSVKSGNVLSPILDYVVKVSETAGISSVTAVKPFIPLVVGGMNLIAGVGNDTALEVGVDTDLSLKKSGVSAIIATDKTDIDHDQLELKKDGTLLHKGEALTCGYVTFSFRKADEKADYGEIQELTDRFAELKTAIRSGNKRDANAAFRTFKLTSLTSPDLITADANRLVTKARALLDAAFAPTANVDRHSVSPEPAEALGRDCLYDLNLYD
jgi:hypothetical protein